MRSVWPMRTAFVVLALYFIQSPLAIFVLCESLGLLKNEPMLVDEYAAFSAGGGVHFKLERTSCQQSLKYLSLYNTEGAPFPSEKKETSFCVIKIRNIILSITHW